MESKFDGQTDSLSDCSAHMWVVKNFDNVDIDNCDLHIFQFDIGFVIFCSFIRFKFSPFCIPLAGQC